MAGYESHGKHLLVKEEQDARAQKLKNPVPLLIEATLQASVPKDFHVPGVHGYLRAPGQGTVQTVKLGKREQASKTEETTP